MEYPPPFFCLPLTVSALQSCDADRPQSFATHHCYRRSWPPPIAPEASGKVLRHGIVVNNRNSPRTSICRNFCRSVSRSLVSSKHKSCCACSFCFSWSNARAAPRFVAPSFGDYQRWRQQSTAVSEWQKRQAKESAKLQKKSGLLRAPTGSGWLLRASSRSWSSWRKAVMVTTICSCPKDQGA